MTPLRQHTFAKGCWRAVVDKVKAANPTNPEEMLRLTTYKVLALCKLRMYSAAFDELNALGGLDSPQYHRDTPDGAVSLVPFAMRWISAQLPGLLGRAGYAVDELYKLAAQCERVQGVADRRTRLVLFTLVNYHVRCVDAYSAGSCTNCTVVCVKINDDIVTAPPVCVSSLIRFCYRSKDYVCALQLCNQLLMGAPNDPDVLSKVAYIQLLMGDTAAAAKTIDQVKLNDVGLVGNTGEIQKKCRRNSEKM